MKNIFVKTLENNGYRITASRLEIINEIDNYPLSAKEIHNNLKKKDVDLVTVYRTLDLLTSLKLLSKTTLDQNTAKYEISNINRHHHHLICEGCGKVKDIKMEDELFFKSIMKKHKFNISSHNLEFWGKCSTCN